MGHFVDHCHFAHSVTVHGIFLRKVERAVFGHEIDGVLHGHLLLAANFEDLVFFVWENVRVVDFCKVMHVLAQQCVGFGCPKELVTEFLPHIWSIKHEDVLIEQSFKWPMYGFKFFRIEKFVLCYTKEHLNKLKSRQDGGWLRVQNSIITVSHYEVLLYLFEIKVVVHQFAFDAKLWEWFPVDAREAASAGETDKHLFEDTVVCPQAWFALLEVFYRLDEISKFGMWTIVLKTSAENKLGVGSPVVKYWIFFYKILLSFGVFGSMCCRFCYFFWSCRNHACVKRESEAIVGHVDFFLRFRITFVNVEIWSSSNLWGLVPDDISVIARST